MNASTHILRVISLRSESSGDDTFEIALRNAGHKVTVLSSTEPAFALLNSSWPDLVLFDPISQFGMSGSIHRMRTGFEGVIIATGQIPDPTISAMLEELGISKFAATAGELLAIVKNVPTRVIDNDEDAVELVVNTTEPVRPAIQTDRQLELTAADTLTQSTDAEPELKIETPLATQTEDAASAEDSRRTLPSLKLPSLRISKINIKLPMKRWHRTALGTAFAAAVVVAVAIPFIGAQPIDEPTENVTKALPVIPQLMFKPLAPLTIDELSGENLPLEIAGIQDQAVIEKPAIAFWGDTAPDAFVTVNGEPVHVSEYGAFVIDYPLVDGANFIEVLASDFQGRTTRQSFTVVSLQ